MILNLNHLIPVSLDSLFHQLSVDIKFLKFHHYLALQFNVSPSTVRFQSEFGH